MPWVMFLSDAGFAANYSIWGLQQLLRCVRRTIHGDGAPHTGVVVPGDVAPILEFTGFVEGVDDRLRFPRRDCDGVGRALVVAVVVHLALVLGLHVGVADDELVVDLAAVGDGKGDALAFGNGDVARVKAHAVVGVHRDGAVDDDTG